MADWNTEFHGVSVRCTECLVQIKTDQVLMDFLGEAGNGSVELAKWVRKEYKKVIGRELEITVESLSVEILIHAYLDLLTRSVEKFPAIFGAAISKALVSACREMEKRTEIIDCGERAIDPNRHVFDSLVPFRGALYMLLGEKA